MQRNYLKRLVAFCALVALSFGARADARSIVAPMPGSERVCADYEVWIDDVKAPVWECRVSAIPFNRVWPGYQRSLDQTETAGFATWQTDSSTTKIVVKTTKSVEALQNVVVRPTSLGITPKIDAEKKEISFEAPGASPIVLEVGGFHNALHLLPFPIYARPEKLDASNLRYFAPGVHKVGRVQLKSGEEVYVDAGAVVYGGFYAENAENIKISGPGIIDAAPFERGVTNGIFKFSKCKNVLIDGIIQRDPDVWSTTLFQCDDATIRNTKLVGLWRYNADGIDVCNSENVLVEKSFLRTFDDGLVVKGLGDAVEKPSRNLVFRENVIWCDWGRAMELGAETRAPKFENIRFENSDIIRTTHIAMDIQHGDRAKISNVVFDNIRVEFDDEAPTPVYQDSDEQKYDPNAVPGYCPELFVIIIQKTFYTHDDENGTVDGVLLKDVQVLGNRRPQSSFTGLDAEHKVTNVRFENLKFGDQTILSAQEAGLRQNEFVEGVRFTGN